ncbi:MAG: hypothetical protein WCL08_03125 [Verrucomicrobiota bacterium]
MKSGYFRFSPPNYSNLRKATFFASLTAFCVLTCIYSTASPALEIPSEVTISLGFLKQDSSTTNIETVVIMGEALYLAEVSAGGKAREWTFDASGVPLGVEIFNDELPPAVQSSVSRLLGSGGTLSALSRTFEHGRDVFEVEIATPKGTRAYAFYGDGRPQSTEVLTTELPPRLFKVLKKRFAGATPDKCFQSEDNGAIYFTVGLPRPNGPLWITFDAEGALSEQEERIEWSEAPPALQNALLEKFTTRDHTRIIRTNEGNEVTFEIWVYTPERLEIYSASQDGTLEKLR